ncbi:MAG: arylsulfatase [Candidatus Hydrogenedentes bacterium]|nr:arylsulfatase [Candidatus Hydrogenedentota bacterium]
MSTASRREFIQQSALLAAGASTLTAFQTRDTVAAERRPNVLLILTDDHGYGDLGCYGNQYLKTPNIDRLHAESTRLTQYHNSPVCTPTRASLMTGRYNYRTCAIDTFRGRAMMHPNEVTIAEMFSFAGYKTGIFGKWHLGDCFPMRACDRGFHESLVLRGGGLKQPSEFPGCGGYFDPILIRDGKPEPHKGYCTDIFAAETIAFMERHKDEPFFAYLPTNAPHSPLIVDDKYAEPYLKMGLDEKTAKFYGMVANIDENVGRVLDAIDRLGIRENTIVLFMTDNGTQAPADAPRFNANMRGQKGTVYEGGIRVPCFVRWPGKVPAGKDIDRLTAHIDIAPTLLKLCGISAPAGPKMDGRSAAALLTGTNDEWPERTLFFQWHRGDVPEPYVNCCARTQRYKLVNGVELYDLEVNPAEADDIAVQHPDIVKRLRSEYETWFGEVSGTRGYDPPEIVIRDEHSNPVYLTVQDMRGGEGGGYGSNGFWKTRFARDGVYDVTLRFNKDVKSGTANVQIGGVTANAPITEGAESTTIKGVRLFAGPASVRGWANKPEPANGAQYVDIAFISA